MYSLMLASDAPCWFPAATEPLPLLQNYAKSSGSGAKENVAVGNGPASAGELPGAKVMGH